MVRRGRSRVPAGQGLQDACKGLLKAGVPLAGVTVYVAFRSYQNTAKGTAWPKVKTVSEQWHIPVRTVARWLKVLESGGYMKAKRGQYGKVYHFPTISAKQPNKKTKPSKKKASDMPHTADLKDNQKKADLPHTADLNGVMMKASDMPHTADLNDQADMPHMACSDMPHMACSSYKEVKKGTIEEEKIYIDTPGPSAEALLDGLMSKGKQAARKVKRDARRKK